MSVKQSFSKTYSGNLTSKSFISRLRKEPNQLRIDAVEELILDRLSAAKFWNIPADYEKAKVLYDNFEKQIDKDYLREIAKKKEVDDLLLRITETPWPKLGR